MIHAVNGIVQESQRKGPRDMDNDGLMGEMSNCDSFIKQHPISDLHVYELRNKK
jgi:hypothetical protein